MFGWKSKFVFKSPHPFLQRVVMFICFGEYCCEIIRHIITSFHVKTCIIQRIHFNDLVTRLITWNKWDYMARNILSIVSNIILLWVCQIKLYLLSIIGLNSDRFLSRNSLYRIYVTIYPTAFSLNIVILIDIKWFSRYFILYFRYDFVYEYCPCMYQINTYLYELRSTSWKW